MTPLLAFLRGALWPAFVAGTVFGFLWAFERGHVEAGLALVPLVAIALLLGVELVLPDRRGEGSLHDDQLWNDAFHSVAGQFGGNAVGQIAFVFSAAWIAGAIGERWGGSLWPAQWSLWVQVPLLVLLADGLDYWRHRLMHEVAWLWPVHQLHHDGERLNVLKSGRGHFLDMLLRSLLCYAPLALAGVPRDVMLAYAAAVTVFGPVAHANLSLRVPSFLHRLVLTPQVHRIHHARPLDLSCSNYANVFPLWDGLFGSFEHPERHAGFAYGIEGDAPRRDVGGQLLAPFAAWRAMWRRARPVRPRPGPAPQRVAPSRRARGPARGASEGVPR